VSAEKIRAILDTQLFLRAVVNPASIPGKLIYGLRRTYQLIASDAIMAEINDVLSRPKLRAKFKTLTQKRVAELLNELEDIEIVNPAEIPAVARDPKDDIFLACAVAAKAQYIVTEDKDLLVLNPYAGIQIIDAEAFLRILQPPADVESGQQKGPDDD
jgi:hypothetical protein